MRSLTEIRFAIATAWSKWGGPEPQGEMPYGTPPDAAKLTARIALNEAFNDIRDLLDDLEEQCSSSTE